MNDNKTIEPKNGSANNSKVALICLSMVFGMGGLAYASVPLYQLFCQVTGYGGTTQVAEEIEGIKVLDREITVRFDANTAQGLDWKFGPEVREVKVKLGELKQIAYKAQNLTNAPLNGTATFNVTPQAMGAYFNKTECFCFTETHIEPNGSLDMPVVFFIDPELDEEKLFKNIQTITLSYTFFPSDELENNDKQVLLNETKIDENSDRL